MGRLDPIARWDIRVSPPATTAPAVRPTSPFGDSGLSASFGRFGVTSPEAGLHVLQPSMSPLATTRPEAGRSFGVVPEASHLGLLRSMSG